MNKSESVRADEMLTSSNCLPTMFYHDPPQKKCSRLTKFLEEYKFQMTPGAWRALNDPVTLPALAQNGRGHAQDPAFAQNASSFW